METLINQATIYAGYAAAVLVALLALDNAVDAIAKAFGNKKIDTLCGVVALKLNGLIEKLQGKPTTGTSSTATFTQTTGV